MYDSVKQYQTDGIDFSDITTGIERKYKECNNDIEKTLMGYELAKNYYLCFRNTDKISYRQKADSLFYLFVCFDEGKLASSRLKLDMNQVQFIENKWKGLSEQDKEALLFYGLLRGFSNGLPEVLKRIE